MSCYDSTKKELQAFVRRSDEMAAEKARRCRFASGRPLLTNLIRPHLSRGTQKPPERKVSHRQWPSRTCGGVEIGHMRPVNELK